MAHVQMAGVHCCQDGFTGYQVQGCLVYNLFFMFVVGSYEVYPQGLSVMLVVTIITNITNHLQHLATRICEQLGICNIGNNQIRRWNITIIMFVVIS